MTPGKLLLPLFISGLVLLMGFASLPDTSYAPEPVSAENQVVILANLKVFLEGPYLDAADSMSTDLNPTDLPLEQPYDSSAFTGTTLEYLGTESVAGWTGALATAVDWVLVELRTTTTATSAFATRAGILLSDGTIVDIDGTSALGFSAQPAGDYYVVVRHRNHLAVMSAGTITFDATTPPLYDFSTAQSQAFGTDPMEELETGVFGLAGAEFNVDAQVTAPDFDAYIANTTAGATGYERSDYNLDGQVTAPDFDLYIANTTAGRTSKVPE